MKWQHAKVILVLCCSIIGAVSLLPAQVSAVSPVDVYEFPNKEVKARYQALIAEFRCPKCLNTNIAGSDAPIAQDLRRTVHRLVVREGLSDAEVRTYLQTRYGDFVLYDPPFTARTSLVWLLPLVIIAIAIGVFVGLHRRARRRDEEHQTLTDEDLQTVRRILED